MLLKALIVVQFPLFGVLLALLLAVVMNTRATAACARTLYVYHTLIMVIGTAAVVGDETSIHGIVIVANVCRAMLLRIMVFFKLPLETSFRAVIINRMFHKSYPLTHQLPPEPGPKIISKSQSFVITWLGLTSSRCLPRLYLSWTLTLDVLTRMA
jgi:hypothetical protein